MDVSNLLPLSEVGMTLNNINLEMFTFNVAGWAQGSTSRRNYMATVAERIQAELLRSRSPLDDDQLAERIGVRRQAINQECRYLASKGLLRRFHPSDSKILNETFD